MAGSCCIEILRTMVEKLKVSSLRHRGFAFFDTSRNGWYVYEMETNLERALHASSLKESECFVYFDESRCRGTDMRLSTNALALVTLHAKLTKDKFLQVRIFGILLNTFRGCPPHDDFDDTLLH